MESSPLSALFLDFDSYFASVEQHAQPELRGKPVGVAPVVAPTSCCIAASYEAKAHGVKTGTLIRDAHALCPGIRIVPARPELYVRMQHKLLEAIESCIHIEAVLSIDELWCWLPYNLRSQEKRDEIAANIKRAIAAVSPAITCTIGVSSNRWLAKMASKMRKPDGYLTIHPEQLPQILHPLKLSDLTGVGRSMEARLHAAGIHSVADLCAASRQQLHSVWNSLEGDRMWLQLHGEPVPELPPAQRKTIGHSHILPPDKRRPDTALAILHKLTQKAALRLRSYGMVAAAMQVNIRYLGGERWSHEARFEHSSDAIFIAKMTQAFWKQSPYRDQPVFQLAVTLHHLLEKNNYTPSLFSYNNIQHQNREKLNAAIDALQKKHGKKSIHLGCDHAALEEASMRISFTHIPDLDIENF